MLNIGNLVPASYMKFGEEEYPDLFKFYTVMPTRSTQSTAANIRRPCLYTSLNGGVRWNLESETSGSTTHGFYDVNYGGNFYFDSKNADSTNGAIMAFAHKSSSSSFGSYKARAGLSYPLRLANQSWEWSSVVAYNTANQPDREICKCPNSNRYFCIKNGGGYAYTDGPWGTANWTTTGFGVSGITLTDDGGFKHICVDPEKDHDALVFLNTNDSNKYIRFYLCNLNDLNAPVNYTNVIFTSTLKQATWKYVSIDFLPGVGYLIFFVYSGNNYSEVRILRTHDAVTGEQLPYNGYTWDGVSTIVGNSPMVQYGSHGWYCPWTKEYYFVPNASQVWSTKDGLNWAQVGVNTGAATTTKCQKFMTDGQNIVIATSGSAYYYSRNKGQTWVNDVTLTPNGFNTNRSTDTIVMPFKCKNNIGIDTSDITLGEYYDTSGNVATHVNNFRTNGYIPVDPSTMYVFYGACKNPYGSIANKQKSFYNRIDYYDSNYNWLSHREGYIVWTSGSGSSYGGREVPCLFTSPSNAAYARISCNISNTTVTQAMVDSYKWYFAKEEDFEIMTKYGDIVVN